MGIYIDDSIKYLRKAAYIGLTTSTLVIGVVAGSHLGDYLGFSSEPLKPCMIRTEKKVHSSSGPDLDARTAITEKDLQSVRPTRSEELYQESPAQDIDY